MEESWTPTLEDIACLLETAGGGDHHPEACATLRWLIEESGGAELYSELISRSGEQPSPMELARLLCAVTSYRGMPEAFETAHWLIAQSEQASRLHKDLEQTAADVGTELEIFNRMTVLDYEHQLKRLLETADDWPHPDEVLDPTRFYGVDYPGLYSLCCAWTERSQGQARRRRLETVRDKLKRPAELHRLLPGNRRRFERLEKWLHDVRDAESAVDSLEEMARLLRVALRAPAS